MNEVADAQKDDVDQAFSDGGADKESTQKASKPSHPTRSLTNDETWRHVREPIGPYKGGTVFFRREDDGNWYAAVALCSNKDQFSRPIGRLSSRRRYMVLKQKSPRIAVLSGYQKPTYELALELYKTRVELST